MNMHDGVNKLWILRANVWLGVDGYKDEIEAIDALIRRALVLGRPGTTGLIKAAVEKALKHLEPEPMPRKCNRHDDCDAANAKARERGQLAAEHCNDECCDECFGN